MDINDNISNYSLEVEMKSDDVVIAYLEHRIIAVDFYRALCNMRWKKKIDISEEEQIINRLKDIEPNVWSCSWRYAGGVIADIRNSHYNVGEDYINFYCSGEEGCVSPLVKECFERMGWTQHPWDD